MKKFLLILSAVALFVSCTKEFDGTYSVSDEANTIVVKDICSHGCPVCDLKHYPAKDADYYEIGSNEYWQCPHCKAYYADANATKRYDGNIYILPTRIIQGEENLRMLAGDFSSGTKGVVSFIVENAEEVALAATVYAMEAELAAIGMSIAQLCENNDDIEAAVSELSGKIDKTQEEIAVLSGKISELQSSISQTAILMNSLSVKIDSLYACVDTLVDRTRSMDRKADHIFEDIENMDDDFHYRKLLDDRHSDLSALVDPCIGTLYALNECISSDMSCLKSAKDYTDSLAIIRMCRMDMNDVVGAWGNDKGNYVTTACNLVRNYSSMSNQTWETFPSVLESYINNHIIWTHQGYVYRLRSMTYDIVITQISYLLAKAYFTNCAAWDRNYADQKCAALQSDYDSMVSSYNSGVNKIMQEDSLYRHCLVNGKTFDVNLLDADDVLVDYVGRLEAKYGSAAVYDSLATCQEMFFRADSLNCLTRQDWEFMKAASYSPEKSFQNVLPSYDDGGMGFTYSKYKDPEYYFNLTFPYTENGKLVVTSTYTEPDVRNIVIYAGNAYNTNVDTYLMGTMTCDGTKTTVSYKSTGFTVGMIFPYNGSLL